MPSRKRFSNTLTHAVNVAEAYEEDGRYIVPIIPTMEGVMNGGLKTREELEKSLFTAHRMDVTETHPFWGIITSPDEVVGTTRNHTLGVDGKLRAEMVIDMEEHPESVTKLKSGLYNDLSTGYWAEEEAIAEPFDFEGKTAMYYEKNIVWDHVAILPNGTAACSQEMGCGSFKNEKDGVHEGRNEGESREAMKLSENDKNEDKNAVKNDCADALAEAEARWNELAAKNSEQIAALTKMVNAFVEAHGAEHSETNENETVPTSAPPESKPAVETASSGAPASVPTVGGVKSPVEEARTNAEAENTEDESEKVVVDVLLQDGSRYAGVVSTTFANFLRHGSSVKQGSE